MNTTPLWESANMAKYTTYAIVVGSAAEVPAGFVDEYRKMWG